MWQSPQNLIRKYISFKLALMAVISARVLFKDELFKSGWWGIEGYGIGMIYWALIIKLVLMFYWRHIAMFEGEEEQFHVNHQLIKRVSGIKLKGAFIGTLSLVLFDFGCDGLTERWLKTPSLAQLDVFNEARFYQVGRMNVSGMRHQEDTFTSTGKATRRYAVLRAVTQVTNGESETFRSYLSHSRRDRIIGRRPERTYFERLYQEAKETLFSAPLVDQCVRPLNRFGRKPLASILPDSSTSKQLRVFTMVEAEHCASRPDWLYLPLGLALFGYELWLLWGLLLIRQEETQKALSA